MLGALLVGEALGVAAGVALGVTGLLALLEGVPVLV